MKKIRICKICGKPIYILDKAVSNEEGEACHADCFDILLTRWIHDKIIFRRSSSIHNVYHVLFTMKGEEIMQDNQWKWFTF